MLKTRGFAVFGVMVPLILRRELSPEVSKVNSHGVPLIIIIIWGGGDVATGQQEPNIYRHNCITSP